MAATWRPLLYGSSYSKVTKKLYLANCMKRIAAILSILVMAASCWQGPSTLVLCTFNVHHCEPTEDGGRCYGELERLFGELGPDVVALQELDSCNARSGEYQAAELGARCGVEYLYHRTIPFGGGSYGLGMLYKPSLKLVDTAILPLPGAEPRGALVAEFEGFVYVSTHLCFKSEENRRESITILSDWLSERYKGKPVFLAGDLNCTDILDYANEWEAFSTDEDTFGHDGAGGRIDYILQLRSGKGASLKSSRVVAEAAGLSDHLPVVSVVLLK